MALAVAAGGLLSGCGLKPKPLSLQERQTVLTEDQAVLFTQQEPVTQPLTLYEAMARALKYNLDHRVKMMEKAVAEGGATLARFDLLPQLMADAGYRDRTNFNASSSKAIETGEQSLVTSTSQDRTRYLGDLVFRWNILDFGVSYFRAQQEGNRALIAEENRRKISHKLMQDVRNAYWRAVSAQRTEREILPVLEEASEALALSREAEQEKLQSPLEALQYRRALVEIVRRLETLLEQQKMAKAELMGLLNLPLNRPVPLAEPENPDQMALPALDLPITRMEELALQLRPELRQEMYQTRISVAETRKALLRLLPGVEVNFGGHYDSNSYLLNQNWAEIGAQISKNVMELLSAPAAIENADNQKALADSRRLAAHMAILTQVHLTQEQLSLAKKQYEWSRELDDLTQKINQHTENSVMNEAMSPLQRIRSSVEAVLTKLQRNQAFADVQAATGQLYVSLGIDPLPDAVDGHDVKSLAKALKAVDFEWMQGHFPQLQTAPRSTGENGINGKEKGGDAISSRFDHSDRTSG
ncbi:TolC family protein [Methylocaldum sp.]|uniref:TolC family protein n=1 Tax=Methylocaldum sp. TaxID=1969727 RepID=UPI002D418831|nr:TolC family protein [Methylocaldum sp.]HYE36514.1 TolC family protein [Methylocaldum sp.]